MATIKEIGEVFLIRRAEIDALDQALAKERRAIQNAAIDAGRLMTGSDKKRRKEIGSTRQELSEALEVIALVTLEQLNNADDIDQLKAEIERINEMLKDDLDRLKDIEGYAETTAKVVSGLAKAAEKVAGIVI
jgi:hypothetical protein